MTAVASPVAERHQQVPSWAIKVAWALTGICTAPGLVGLVWRFSGGKAAVNYGSYVSWGLWIAAYVALVGASAGAFALSALIFTQRHREQYRWGAATLGAQCSPQFSTRSVDEDP